MPRDILVNRGGEVRCVTRQVRKTPRTAGHWAGQHNINVLLRFSPLLWANGRRPKTSNARHTFPAEKHQRVHCRKRCRNLISTRALAIRSPRAILASSIRSCTYLLAHPLWVPTAVTGSRSTETAAGTGHFCFAGWESGWATVPRGPATLPTPDVGTSCPLVSPASPS